MTSYARCDAPSCTSPPARALEELYEDRIESHLSAIAFHFAKAAPQGDVPKAADYAWWAGERAAATYAYEDAVSLYATSLRLFDTLSEVVPQRRCDLLLALGDAQWRAGEAEGARKTFSQAASTARELALNDHYARAALGYGGGPGGFSITDRADEQLLVDAGVRRSRCCRRGTARCE